jgi:hypothetical protein
MSANLANFERILDRSAPALFLFLGAMVAGALLIVGI